MAELHVSKKTIKDLFSGMQDRKFIIPDYQRPYKWDKEKCETLWNDIENFTITEAQNGSDYFLGTIVSYQNKEDGKNNLEIIDGQQRITSILLMLRAFYCKLEKMIEDDDVIGLKNQLAPCIWDINPISQKVSDKTQIHIISKVATEEDNETFHKILETGNCEATAKDNYSINFTFFQQKCDNYAEHNPMQWKQLCITILQKCIILPIECVTQDTALTIFSTLNDRGLPLCDADIFKAQIYRHCETENQRNSFTQQWKELMHICKYANLSVDDIFRYYTHVLRARKEDNSKEIGLRKFYARDKYAQLKDNNLMKEILSLAGFWRYMNTGVEPDGDVPYKISINSWKFLHCLSCYPNEYWKYVVSVFYLKNETANDFDIRFIALLKKMTAFLFAKFVENPSVNAIKDDIFYACISVNRDNIFNVKYDFNQDGFKMRVINFSSSKLSRALLLLDAYLNPCQQELIPQTFDIEHILPKKWQNTNYNGWSEEDAQNYIDNFGNKVAFEKKLNIQAGNGYFRIKKQKYALSKIANAKELANYEHDDWAKEDIEKRNMYFTNNLISFFNGQLSIS